MFAISSTQLAAAGGHVRCGNCLQAFDARGHLVDELPGRPELVARNEAEPPQAAQTSSRDRQSRRGAQSPTPVPDELAGDYRRSVRRRVSPWIRSLQFLTILVLSAGLAFQGAWFMTDELVARWPRLGPVLSHLLEPAGRALAPPRDPGRIGLISRNVRAHPQRSDGLQVTANLVNRAPYEQPYPVLELTLFDVNGSVIGRRGFYPAEYLGPGKDGQTMRPGRPVEVTLELKAPEPGAVSYEFEFY